MMTLFLALDWRSLLAVALLAAVGCQSPYYADRGAAGGGLLGAGVGALVGSQTGNTGAGAAIGAGLGALTGAAVGSQMDDVAAQNRALIAGQLGRQVAQGAATPEEVIAMSRAGVSPALIVGYINSSGSARPLSANDVIALHQQGVDASVIQALQNPPPPPVAAQAVPPGPVIVEEHYYGAPACYGPPVHVGFGGGYGGRRRCGTRVGFGVSL